MEAVADPRIALRLGSTMYLLRHRCWSFYFVEL